MSNTKTGDAGIAKIMNNLQALFFKLASPTGKISSINKDIRVYSGGHRKPQAGYHSGREGAQR